MTAWGVGSFDNESAKAFVLEVLQDGEVALHEAFDVVLDPDLDFVEAEEGHRALAAAEIVAASVTGDTSQIIDEGLRAWLDQADPTELEDLREAAAEAVERVHGPDSELPDLWEDSADASAWRKDVQRLKQQLM